MVRRSIEDLRTALGADIPVPVHARPHGPFGVEWLASELALAEQISTEQRKVSPAQVASLLLEREVDRLAGSKR